MEVKPGYKQTEVGVIPKEWEVTSLQAIGQITTGPFGTLLKAGEYSTGEGTPLISVGEVGDGVLRVNEHTPLVPPSVVKRLPQYVLISGDIVFGRKGSVERSGLVSEDQTGWFLGSDGIRFRPSILCDSQFIIYQCQSKQIQSWLLRDSTGTTMPSLNQEILKRVSLPLPAKPEQHAVAAVLSDAYALIESLEQLISKKRHLKKGAMQELLTGNRRLPGFSAEWGRVCLRDLLFYERPDRYIVQDSDYSNGGDTPVLTANKSFILGYTAENFGICRDLPAIVFDDFTTASKYADFPFKVKSSAIKLLRPEHDQVDLRFVFDLMQMIRFPLGDHKRYYISEFQNIEMAVPDHEEQLAIEGVLGDMDSQVAALECQLAKARALKQGMMQQLLTGRIRLIVETSTICDHIGGGPLETQA